jgi:predicted N-acyltransferase
MSRARPLALERLSGLGTVAPGDWNALTAGNPFSSHEFLTALERSGCVGAGTSWQPEHLILRDSEGRLVGAMPLYIKHDSRGEFVFDWGWAEAYARAGRDYYPKLVGAIPFTPATGPRLLVRADEPNRTAVIRELLSGALTVASDVDASSIHVLFPATDDCSALAAARYLCRKSCQFHWHNEQYADFDDFLAQFTSEKRKKVRRERRRIREANIEFEHLLGNELAAHEWDAVFDYYSRTFLQRGRHPYLNRAFFDEISRTMPHQIVVILARYAGRPIATAICFRSQSHFYGRYWGSLAEFHSLHFETCYYQGIDYCIRERLEVFEPGTQGEHKISRGFSPTPTWSYHHIFDDEFRAAVGDFLDRETHLVDEYIGDLGEHVPYRKDRA